MRNKLSLLKSTFIIILCFVLFNQISIVSAQEEYIIKPTEIEIAAKRPQPIEDAPSAVYIITAEDIRLYGANNVGEALRMVPGIEIFQGGDQNYEVSIRGLSRTQYNTSNKVLWLINGRTVYQEAFGGARIQSFNITMEDIKRIEIVRGPGSALYGANAFAGVINIITKSPTELKNGIARVVYGNLGQLQFSFRNGYKLNDKLSLAISFNHENLDQKNDRFYNLNPIELDSLIDRGHTIGTKNSYNVKDARFALQYDINTRKKSFINLHSGFSENKADHYFTLPGELPYETYFIQADYHDSNNNLRVFYNRDDGLYNNSEFMKRDTEINNFLVNKGRKKYIPADNCKLIIDMVDIEYQRSYEAKENLKINSGISYRKNFADFTLFSLDGDLVSRTQDLFALYSQLAYSPIKDKLIFFVGGRYDKHSVVGISVNPRFSLIYKPLINHRLRFSLGSAIRNPHLLDIYADLYTRIAGNLSRLTGLSPIYNLTTESDYILSHGIRNTIVKSEKIISTEIGYRIEFSEKLYIEADLFYNIMTDPLILAPNKIRSTIDTVENIRSILGIENSEVISNEMAQEEMISTISLLESTGDPTNLLLANGLKQILPVYGIPKVIDTSFMNGSEEYKFYGGELSLNYKVNINKNPKNYLSFTGNYAYVKFSDEYNSEMVEGRRIPVIKSPEHKFNIGITAKYKGFYSGIMFNFMSGTKTFADNNKNYIYDLDDLDVLKYSNAGIYKIGPRKNLNINIGFTWTDQQNNTSEIFITGYNLIQDNYQQFQETLNSYTEGDYLNRRIVGGFRFSF